MKISEIYEAKSGMPKAPNMKNLTNNLVAKHAHKFNKGGAHPSKKDYNRKTKHNKIDTDAY